MEVAIELFGHANLEEVERGVGTRCRRQVWFLKREQRHAHPECTGNNSGCFNSSGSFASLRCPCNTGLLERLNSVLPT